MMSVGSCVVSGGLAAILRVNKWLCLAPLRFHKEQRGYRVTLSPQAYYIGNFLVTIFNGAQLWNTGDVLSQLESRVDILTVLFESTLVLAPSSLSTSCARAHMRCLIHTLNDVQQINSDMNVKLWSKQVPTKLQILMMSWVVISVIMMTLYILVTSTDIVPNFIPPTVVWFTYVEDGRQGVSPGEAARVRRACCAYVRACDTVRAVTRAHGALLIIMLSIYVVQLIISPYYIINILRDGYNKEEPIKLLELFIEMFCWFATIVKLILLVEPCHDTHLEMAATRELVGRLMRRPGAAGGAADELGLFYKQLVLNDDVAYQPMQVTTIQRSLFLTIIACITTYLVIMLNHF